jgi:hypothetical protein
VTDTLTAPEAPEFCPHAQLEHRLDALGPYSYCTDCGEDFPEEEQP